MKQDVVATKQTARIAGALYLSSAVAAGVPTIFLSATLVVDGNTAATRQNVLSAEMLFRAGIVSELLGAILFLLLVRELHRLVSRFDESRPSLMLAFVLVSVPVTFINVLNEIAALTLFRGATFLPLFTTAQRDAARMLLLGCMARASRWPISFGVYGSSRSVSS